MYTASKRIAELREQGWRVKVQITRPVPVPGRRRPELASRKDGVSGDEFISKGGFTMVTLIAPTDNAFTAISRCNSKLDNFNKKLGLEIAFGRAYKQYELELTKKTDAPTVEKIPHGIKIGG